MGSKLKIGTQVRDGLVLDTYMYLIF